MFRKSLIMISAVLLLTSFAFVGSTRADGTPTPERMNMGSTPEANGDHGERIPANGASVQILSPRDGEVLANPTVIVRVETADWPLGAEGHHWHLYVNGKEQGMSQGNSPALQARDLQPGQNILEAVLSNERHQELNATDKITVRYEEPAGAQTTAALSIPPGAMIVLLGIGVAVAAILGMGFALTRRKP